MFDIGLSELALIAVVALVVVGPKRLPMVARTAGNLLGRAQRYIRDVKDEVSQQVALEELKQASLSLKSEVALAQHAVSEGFNQVRNELQQLSPIDKLDSLDSLGRRDGMTTVPYAESVSAEERQHQVREFRRKSQQQRRLPLWYKQQQGVRRQVQSAAARVVRYRDKSLVRRRPSFFS